MESIQLASKEKKRSETKDVQPTFYSKIIRGGIRTSKNKLFFNLWHPNNRGADQMYSTHGPLYPETFPKPSRSKIRVRESLWEILVTCIIWEPMLWNTAGRRSQVGSDQTRGPSLDLDSFRCKSRDEVIKQTQKVPSHSSMLENTPWTLEKGLSKPKNLSAYWASFLISQDRPQDQHPKKRICFRRDCSPTEMNFNLRRVGVGLTHSLT